MSYSKSKVLTKTGSYDHKKVEDKWRDKWAKDRIFEVDLKRAKKPFYNLMMFPYPSGEGLHVGHVYAFGGADTFGRLKRMQGYDVFEPMGFDAFGIHSENYAIKVGQHPREIIAQTVEYFREKQLKKLGALFDWRYEVNTTDPKYYRWTQWLFLQLYKAGLAERKKAPVNFCPSCKTVLADEQVIGGKCERCESLVEKKELEQWFFRITKYADQLLKNLEWINWSETTKTLQRNWIGKSEGVIIKFPVARDKRPEEAKSENWSLETSDFVEVFTTRPDTIYGATFVVLAPDHPLIESIKYQVLSIKKKEIENYVEKAKKEKIAQWVGSGTKTGVFTGLYCINPFTKEEIPIYISDYVSMAYGTGAIMGVPAHDQRDFEFAKKYKLPIKEVISPTGKPQGALKTSCEDYGILLNSDSYSGMRSQEAIKKLSNHIEKNKLGSRTVNYHLRDWLISRQRYWGPPIPIVYCRKCGIVPVPEKDLPVLLPDLKDFQPKGKGVSPLSTLEDWVKVTCPSCGGRARRETDVSDTFLDSSWYYLRYPSADRNDVVFDRELTKRWLPVDSYIGGNEHATLHLLYVRFLWMVLHDLGLVKFDEPFKKFRAHGLIIHQGAKMSKSRGNVVNPNEYMEKYGADSLRMYLLFIGPFDQGGDFSDLGISGVFRFINRVYSLINSKVGGNSPTEENLHFMHKTIKRVGDDIENLRFNTAIAAIMEYVNYLTKKEKVSKKEAEVLILILAPLAPHLAEELWKMVGNANSVHHQKWPAYEAKYLWEEKITIVVQVNGKLRDKLLVEDGMDEENIKNLAIKSQRVLKYINQKEVKNIIWVPNRLINIVTN